MSKFKSVKIFVDDFHDGLTALFREWERQAHRELIVPLILLGSPLDDTGGEVVTILAAGNKQDNSTVAKLLRRAADLLDPPAARKEG